MTYDYVKRAYGVDPVVGGRVQHTETGRYGKIAKEREPRHYVHVQFDGRSFASPCHPTALNYAPVETVGQEGAADRDGPLGPHAAGEV